MSTAAIDTKPLRFAGLPLSAWAFAFRTWLAMVIALYAAFWLQLDGAATAATCVGIIALPTRGHAAEKAAWRLFGTAVGVVASIAIVGAFNQVRELMCLSFAAWMAVCVYAARLLDGNRAYGAVLSGYTVAIVAISQIDAPQNVFMAAINRGAAIWIGVLAVSLVNDVFAAPHLSDAVQQKLADARQRVRAFAITAIKNGAPPSLEVGRLLQAVTAIRSDINAVAAEGAPGGHRAKAAAAALPLLVREIIAARTIAMILDNATEGETAQERERLAAAIEDGRSPTEVLVENSQTSADTSSLRWKRPAVATGIELLLQQEREAGRAIARMSGGWEKSQMQRLPIFRSRRAALRDAIRIFCVILILGALLPLTGWPAASAMLVAAAALAALGSGAPDPLGFVKAACVIAPIIGVLTGITKFVLLDGADAFPLLAIAMAPMIMLGGLLVSIPNQAAFLFGFLTMVFCPMLLSPTNPEDYGALAFLTNVVLTVGGLFVLLPALAVLFPTTDEHRRRWIMESAVDDCAEAFAGHFGDSNAMAGSFRDASRIGQLSALKAVPPADLETDVERACRLAEMSYAAKRSRELAPNDAEVQNGLCRLDATALRRCADRFMTLSDHRGDFDRDKRHRSGLLLAWLADLIDRNPTDALQIRGARS